MTGKGYTLQGVLKDASGKEIVKLQGEVEEILDLEHKACLLYTSWKMMSTTTGTFINAGHYKVLLSAENMDGLAFDALDIQ